MSATNQLSSKFLSVVIVLGSLVFKVPQIVVIIQQKTAQGLSYPSMILEIILMMICVGYSYHFSYPITTYLEFWIILTQCYIILFLAYYYRTIDLERFTIATGICLTLGLIYALDLIPEILYIFNELLIAVIRRLQSSPSGCEVFTPDLR